MNLGSLNDFWLLFFSLFIII